MEVREDADLYGQILKVGITRDSNTNRCWTGLAIEMWISMAWEVRTIARLESLSKIWYETYGTGRFEQDWNLGWEQNGCPRDQIFLSRRQTQDNSEGSICQDSKSAFAQYRPFQWKEIQSFQSPILSKLESSFTIRSKNGHRLKTWRNNLASGPGLMNSISISIFQCDITQLNQIFLSWAHLERIDQSW